MFKAICVSTGKSCKAMLIHCALHPVAAIAIASTRARKVFDLELVFIGFSSGMLVRTSRPWSFVVSRRPRSRAGGERRKTNDAFLMKSLDDYLRDAEQAHGHLCAGQVLGVRMAML